MNKKESSQSGVWRAFNNAPSWFHSLLSVLIFIPIFWLDLHVSAEHTFTVLYLIPIAYISWFCDSAWVYGISVLAVTTWAGQLLFSGAFSFMSSNGYWHFLGQFLHFALFTLVSVIIARLRALTRREHEESELKTKMLSFVSHEFCNRIMTMRLAMKLLKDADGEESRSARDKHFAVLDASCAELYHAVVNFLNMNRFEAGKFKPELAPVALGASIKNAVLLVGPLYRDRDVRFKLNLPAVPVSALADRESLVVVLSNLLYNAFKYTPDGGSVTVNVVPDPSGAGSVRIVIEDTGIGISRSDFKKIGVPFFRAESAKKMALGYGVGLRIVRELLDSQNSRLFFRSAAGRGSIFYFDLPISESAEEPVRPYNEKAAVVSRKG